jgi:uncharacterized protein YrrD
MQRNINSLTGYKMDGIDGEIGKVDQFYFDDDTWTIRYLIVTTGNWFSGRKVLISTNALITNSHKADSFPVNLTMEQILNSPDIDTDKPVSAQQEIELANHYGWMTYWGNGFYAGGALWNMNNPQNVAGREIIKNEDAKKPDGDRHLRSSKEVTGYHIHAIDGEIGHLNDFIIDDKTWKLIYAVVDTHNWIGGKKVLLPVSEIIKVEWDDSKIFVDVKIDSIKNAPDFIESKFSHSENEAVIF